MFLLIIILTILRLRMIILFLKTCNLKSLTFRHFDTTFASFFKITFFNSQTKFVASNTYKFVNVKFYSMQKLSTVSCKLFSNRQHWKWSIELEMRSILHYILHRLAFFPMQTQGSFFKTSFDVWLIVTPQNLFLTRKMWRQ